MELWPLFIPIPTLPPLEFLFRMIARLASSWTLGETETASKSTGPKGYQDQ